MASAMNSLPPGFVIESPPDNARPARPKAPALPPGFVVERQPQTFQSLPAAPLRQQRQEDAAAPGIGDYASEFGNATVRGAAGTTAGILRGANVLTTDSPDEIRRTEEGIARLKTMTAEQATDFMRSLPSRLSPAVAFNYQVAIRKLWDGKTDEAQSYLDRARGYTDTRPIDEQGLSKAAAAIEGAANKSFPQDPRFRGSITSDLGQGLGSTAAFLPIGLLTGGTGVAVAGAAAGADQGYQEATRDLAAQRRDDRGEAYNSGLGTEAQVKALQAGRLSALPGASEVVPVETFIQQAPRFIPGLRPIAGSPAFKRFARAFGRVGTQVLAEGGQEAFQTWAGNVINQITVDPSQALDENVLYNFAIGGAVGGGMQTVMEGYGAATGGEPPAPQPPPPAAPPPGQGRAEPRLFPDRPPGPEAGPAAPPPPRQQAAPQPDQPAPARPAPPPGFVVEDVPASRVDPGDEAYLRGAGYTPEQIADMNAPERAAAVQEARQQGVEPVPMPQPAEAAQARSKRHPAGPAIWANQDSDVPVTILDEPPQADPNTGALYQRVQHSGNQTGYVPFDELQPQQPAVTPPPPGTAPMAPRGTRQSRQPVQTPDDLEAVRPVVNTEPSAAQAQAGNYQKAHVRIAGMDVTIENPRGSIRRSKDDADPWQSPALPADYGYIKRTTGKDGDQVDVYIGPDPQSDRVFVIDQMNLKTGKFDEHKAVLGARELGEAVDLYVNSFDNPTLDRIGDVTEMSVDDFRQWVRDGRNTKRPAAKAGVGTVTPNVPEAQSQAPEAIGQPQMAAPDQPDGPRYNPTTIRGEVQDALRRYLDGTGPVTPEAFARFAKIDVAEAGKALQYAGLRGGLIVGKNGNWRRPRTFKGPANVLDFIASIGGIKDVTGELRGMDLPKMTQFGPVVRKNGLHPDRVREQLIEAGYLFDPGRGTSRQQQTTVADVYDLIAQHMSGIQVFAAQDQAEADAIRVQRLNENMPDDWQPQNPVEGRFGPEVWADIQDYFARSGTTEEDWKTVELRDAARLIAGGMEADDAFERVAIQRAALLDDTEGLDPALEAAFQNGNPNAMVASQDVPFPDLETLPDAVEQQGPQEAGDGIRAARPDRLDGAGQAGNADLAAEVRGPSARGGQEGGRGQDAGPVSPATEPGAEGKPQLVIPGAEQDVRGAMQNAAKAPLKASAPQKGMDIGLFGSERDQTDMFDQPQVKAEQPKAGLLDRETWPNGKWKAVKGDRVYLRVAGPFGTPASVNGEVVTGKDGDLRVRISGSSSILGGRYTGRQSRPYDSSWTVDDDPFYRNQEAKQKAEQEAKDKAWRDEMSANTEKAVADAKAAVAAGDKPLTFENARIGLRVKGHHPVSGGDMVVGDIVEFEKRPTIFYYENGRLDEAPRSAGPNEWFTVPQPEQLVSIPKYDEDGNLIEPAADDDFGAMFDEAVGSTKSTPKPAASVTWADALDPLEQNKVRSPVTGLEYELVQEITLGRPGSDRVTAQVYEPNRDGWYSRIGSYDGFPTKAEAVAAILEHDSKQKPVKARPAKAPKSVSQAATSAANIAAPVETPNRLVIQTGVVLRTKSGRETSPAPKIEAANNRKTLNTLKRMYTWLLDEARKEADGNDWQTQLLRGINVDNLSQSDQDQINLVLFGDPDGATSDNVVRVDTGKKSKTASQAATSAVKNAAMGIDEVFNGLSALFGGKNKLSSGFTFDEDTYRQALPFFKAGVAHFAQAGRDFRAMINALVDYLKAKGMKGEQLLSMRPYVVRFMEDIRDGKESLNAPGGSEVLEPDSGDADAGDGMGAADVPAPAGAVGSGAGKRGAAGGRSGGRRSGGGRRISESDAPVVGEGGNLEIPARDPEPLFSNPPDTEPDGSLADGGERLPDERIPTLDAIKAVAAPPDLATRKRAQKAAERIAAKPGDLANIRETLPLLHPEQQDDVYKVEQRFAKPDGHGMLLTNGTGTGKTFSGLGVVKRFAKQGKTDILIVAPSQGILEDWVKSAKAIGLDVSILESTQDKGKGIVATTYANLGQNLTLADRNWDLVVTDESHKLSSDANGTATSSLEALRAITLHPDGMYRRGQMVFRKEWARVQALIGEKGKQRLPGYEDAWAAWRAKYDAARPGWQEMPRGKVLMLSATPFAYHFSLDYAEGYLFNYPVVPQSGAYNAPGPRDQFYIENFGYQMRTGKLNKPDADVRGEVMERQFHEKLKKSGSLSGRALEVEKDYDRKFILVESGIGNKIDDALKFLREADNRKFWPLYEIIDKQFDHLTKLRLLEAIKAQAAIPYIKKSIALGRKAVVFHDYNEGGGISPFELKIPEDLEVNVTGPDGKPAKVKPAQLYREFHARNPWVKELKFGDYPAPISALKQALPNALVYNGTASNKERSEAKRLFNEDNNGYDVIVVQSAAGEAGISLHDITNVHQRVLVNLGMPPRPMTALQQEGRIYRVGQASDAMFRYMNTGTAWERHAFATKMAQRSSTAENLAMGDQARTIRQSFVDAYEAADDYEPKPGEGTGGKAIDRANNEALSEFEKAKTHYFAQAKNRKRRDQREGIDYFATPEPLGLKMVEWANVKPGEKILEPSAGHGAISRYFPEDTARTLVEPSSELSSRAALTSPGARVVMSRFEDLDIVNKYDAIVMNPPFGTGGKTAIDHIEKASKHLRNGGRIVALIPRGGMADKRFEDWYEKVEDIYLVGKIELPTVTFERAGTSVRSVVVVLERQTDKDIDIIPSSQQRNRDFTNAETINQLFDRLEDVEMAPRVEPKTKETDAPVEGEVTLDGLTFNLRSTKTRDGEFFYADLETRAKDRFRPLVEAAQSVGGDWSRVLKTFSFPDAAKRQAFLDQVAKGLTAEPAPAAAPTEGGAVPVVSFKTAEFLHTKTRAKLFAAVMQDRVSSEDYQRINAVAKKHGGYYSAYRGGGAVPGFIFPSEDARIQFMAELAGPRQAPLSSRAPQGRISSAPAAPVFYSALLRAVEGMKQEKGAKTQWMGAIRNVPGVKAEEIAWIGLEDWLSQQSGVITKQQITDFIRANQVQVQEVLRGKTAKQRLDELSAIEPENRTLQQQNEYEDIIEGNWTGENSIAPTATKYDGYQLPGGENYRELLLTLPENDTVTTESSTAPNGWGSTEGGTQGIVQRGDRGNDYRSGHWDEPNVLAHVRLNERIDADGKRVLFVEEIQSDWHQAGRKQGYNTDAVKWQIAEINGKWVLSLPDRPNTTFGTFDTRAAAEARRARLVNKTTVPDAPFKTTWPELAMKRVIRWAAENGFDRVAWTPGSVQAERYDLSKQISRVVYEDNHSGKVGIAKLDGPPTDGVLWAYDLNGRKIIEHSIDDPAKVADYIGKDLAEKLLEQPGYNKAFAGWSARRKELSGLDLRVGGQGMIGFYDKILVDVANKLGKKFGARTATTKMPTTAEGWGVALSGEFVDENRYDSEADVRIVMRQGGLTEAGGFKPLLDVDGSAIAVHSLDITPDMRAAAMQGQPLFRARDDANQPSSPVFNRFRFAISDRQSRELTAEINQIAQRILGRRLAAVSVTDRLPGDEDAYFDPNTGVIYIALQSVLDPRFNIRHEAVHALRQAGVLSEREWAVLSRMARTRWIEQYGIRERYGDLYRDRFDVTPDQLEELMVEEAIADAMAEQAMRPPGDDVVSRIFYRVRQFLRAVANMLAGRGFTTPEQILSNIEAGGVAQRRQGMGRNRGFMLYAKQESAAPQDQTQTEAFRNWFGDSKVVDEQGKPLVVYHGTEQENLTHFDPAKIGALTGVKSGAFWFSSSEYAAGFFGPEKVPAYLSMQNPLVVTPEVRDEVGRGRGPSWWVRKAKEGGHDGLIMLDDVDGDTPSDVYAVFDPTQIKSATGNNGNFDPRRQSILESQRQESNQPPLSSVPPDDGGAGARFAQARAAATDDERAMAEFAGNINLSKIESAEDIKDVIRDAAEKADGFIAARRGVVSHDQTKELAEQLGMSVKQLLKRKSGQAFNAHEAYAARVMLVKSAEIVKKAAAKAKNTTSDVDRAYFMRVLTRHAAIQEQVAGMTAEAGRALNQFKMMAGADYLRGVGEMLSEKTSRGNMGPEAVRDMAEMIDSLDTPGQVGRMTRDMFKPRFIDMIREYYINSLLSGPATQTVNFMSNMLVALNQIPETFVAEQIGRIHGGDKVARGETMARAVGLLEGSREGLQLAWMALKTGEPQSPETQFDQPMQKAIPGLAGEVIRLPSRLMMSSDEFFKTVNYRAELTAMAVRTAQAEGLDGDALAERILDLRNNPTPAMIQRAAAAGKYQTFQNKLGTKGQTLMRFREAWQLWWLLPFLRTPINILKYAAERSPLGPILMSEVRENLSGKKGGAARDTQIARIALGTVMLAGMGAIVMSGMATGGGSDDEREKAVMRADGWQPYSLNIDGKYYSYLRFDPFSLHLGIVADMVELRDKISKGEYENIGWMLMASIINNVTDKTWLKSATEFSRMTMDPKAYMENYLSHLASGFVPNLLAQIARSQDPAFRDARGVLDKIKERVPGFRETLPQRYDIFGEPITGEGNVGPDLFSPVYVSTQKSNPIAQAMVDAEYFPGKPRRQINGHDLTAEQYAEYTQMSGKEAVRRLERIVKAPSWSQRNQDSKEQVLKRGYDQAREIARKMLMRKYPELRAKADQVATE